MNKEFFKNIIILISINLLIKPIYIFGIDRSVQNLVGESVYGNYAALFSFAFLLQIVNDFGIQNFNSRVIAQHRQLLNRYLSGILTLKIVLATVYMVVLFVAAFIVQYQTRYYPMLFMLGIYNILLSLNAYLRSNIASLGMYGVNSFLSVLDRLLLLLICPFLLFVEPFNSNFRIEWFVLAQNVTMFCSVVVSFIICFRKVERFNIKFNIPFLLSILRGATPYALAIFLMTIYTRTDIVMLERMLPDGDRQAGIYSSAYRLLDAVNVLGVLFASLLMPMFASQIQKGESITPLLRFSFQLIMVAALTCAGSIWFFRTEIMQILYHEATPFSGDVLGVLMCSFVAVSGTYIYSTLIGASGSVMKMNTTFIIAFVLNIGLNVYLIPTYKAVGVAISTLITQFYVMFSLVFLSKKLNLLRGDNRWSLVLVGYALAVFCIGFFLKNYSFISFWFYNMLITIVLSFVLASVLGILDYKKIEKLFNSNTN